MADPVVGQTVSPADDHQQHPRPPPQPGTYVVQIPKDQVYRVPPPENAALYKNYTSRKHRRASRCHSCFCCLLFIAAAFLLLSAVAAVFYLVVRPEPPNYSLQSLSFTNFNLTSAAAATSSPPLTSQTVNATLSAENPNRKIGIYYMKRQSSSADVYYNDVMLCEGSLPAFYQPPENATQMRVVMEGKGVRLTREAREGLAEAERKSEVPLKLHVRAPVRIKVGPFKTWVLKFKVDCDLTVDKLSPDAKIVSKDCDYGVDLW